MTCDKHVIAFSTDRYPVCPLCKIEEEQERIAEGNGKLYIRGKEDVAKRIRNAVMKAGDNNLAMQAVRRIVYTEVFQSGTIGKEVQPENG